MPDFPPQWIIDTGLGISTGVFGWLWKKNDARIDTNEERMHALELDLERYKTYVSENHAKAATVTSALASVYDIVNELRRSTSSDNKDLSDKVDDKFDILNENIKELLARRP